MMNGDLRAAMAFLLIAMQGGARLELTMVQDSKGEIYPLSWSGDDDEDILIFYTTGAHLVGERNGLRCSVYDTATASLWEIVSTGHSFRGVNLTRSEVFMGTINGHVVTLKDSDESFEFRVF
jgi:hypothetical protein